MHGLTGSLSHIHIELHHPQSVPSNGNQAGAPSLIFYICQTQSPLSAWREHFTPKSGFYHKENGLSIQL